MTKLSMKTIRFNMITGVCIGMIWMIFSHDRIGVMYFGKLVEMANADELFRYPLHPYTRSLLQAIPEPDPIKEKKRVKIHYDPSIHNYSDENRPSYHEVSPGHMIYCSDSEFEEYKKIRQAVTIQQINRNHYSKNNEIARKTICIILMRSLTDVIRMQ